MRQSAKDAKRVICEIIAAFGGQLPGKLRLYKAFYYAHLYYWQSSKGTLTDYPIVRMPMGPGIDAADALIEQLEREGRIRVTKQMNGPYTEHVFELVKPVCPDPQAPQYKAIQNAVRFINNKSTPELSEETHLYSRSWRESKDGEVLNIYVDILDESDYEKVKRGLADTEELLSGIFT